METFRVFKDPSAAEDLARWLTDRGIKAEVADTSAYFDPSFAHSILSKEWSLRMPAEDFSKARELLQQFYLLRISAVPKDYYLFSFTDDELDEILLKPDEWGDLDYTLAQQILRDRGRPVSESQLQALRDQRYEALSKPDDEDAGGFVVWGYVLSIAGGLLGSLIGWYLMSSHMILPDGKKLHRYNEPVRRQGKRIFWIGIVVSIVIGLARMYFLYQKDIGAFFP